MSNLFLIKGGVKAVDAVAEFGVVEGGAEKVDVFSDVEIGHETQKGRYETNCTSPTAS